MKFDELKNYMENSIPKPPHKVLKEWEVVKRILIEGQGFLTKDKHPIQIEIGRAHV